MTTTCLLFDTFFDCLAPHLGERPIYVAYSGGVDSQVLLHLLFRLKQQCPSLTIGAVHIHHGLSVNADHWLAHCQHWCSLWQIPLLSARLSLQKKTGESLEAIARTARYAAIAKRVPQNSMVLLGHHLQDQLETLLLQLKRGAGPKGLSAMGRQLTRDGLHYLRPLLDIERSDIVAYAEAHGLCWIEDESNQDQRFDRNFLRHTVVPLLTSRWPAIARTASRCARLCAEQQQLLDEVVSTHLHDIAKAPDVLDISKLRALSWRWQQQVIRMWLADNQVPAPSEAQLQRLDTEVLAARDDASPCLSVGDYQLRRFDNGLYLLKPTRYKPLSRCLWQGQTTLDLEDGRRLLFSHRRGPDAESGLILRIPDGQPVYLESGGYSRRFKPPGAAHSKPLKQWFKHWRIPPWERASLIIVCCADKVAGVVGIGPDQAFAAGDDKGQCLHIRESRADTPH